MLVDKKETEAKLESLGLKKGTYKYKMMFQRLLERNQAKMNIIKGEPQVLSEEYLQTIPWEDEETPIEYLVRNELEDDECREVEEQLRKVQSASK